MWNARICGTLGYMGHTWTCDTIGDMGRLNVRCTRWNGTPMNKHDYVRRLDMWHQMNRRDYVRHMDMWHQMYRLECVRHLDIWHWMNKHLATWHRMNRHDYVRQSEAWQTEWTSMIMRYIWMHETPKEYTWLCVRHLDTWDNRRCGTLNRHDYGDAGMCEAIGHVSHRMDMCDYVFGAWDAEWIGAIMLDARMCETLGWIRVIMWNARMCDTLGHVTPNE